MTGAQHSRRSDARPKWSDEQSETVAKLWIDGWSAGQIAERFNLSRNAVIGKVHRLGLKREAPSDSQREPRPRRPSNPAHERLFQNPKGKPKPSPAKPVQAVPLASLTDVSMLWTQRTRSQCAYPISGEGHQTFYCCHPISRGSYCDTHAAICYVGKAA